MAFDGIDLVSFRETICFDPHHSLGLHGGRIFLWRPGAEVIFLEVKGEIVSAQKVGEEGLFSYLPKEPITFLEYRIYHQNGLLAHDPYSFASTIGDLDRFLFNKGCHYNLYEVLGSTVMEFSGVEGVRFAVWAPNAKRVSLVADFNFFDGRLCPMKELGSSGIWEIFIPGIGEREKYKFEIETKQGKVLLKSDPFAFYSELRPNTASVVQRVDGFDWGDGAWLERRAGGNLNRPINIYEVHLGSWKNYDSLFPGYIQLAQDLAQYCKEMGFTHVELMPIMEHPFDPSWGYQVSGFFSVTSRYGFVRDFQAFVDHLHQQEIGVILDWVPAHFPTDEHLLSSFDGTSLYEHEDPSRSMHPHWQTAIFNYGRKEVANFLIASALFWCDKMHIDGLRVDAVSSILYLDYGRKPGEWQPNADGSSFNFEGIEFLKHLNSAVHQRFPSVLMIAEESSSFQGVTHLEGLGFDLKWNMGWMNDTLSYFEKDPIYRKYEQGKLTFSLLYAFSEKFLSVLSHDEVVHGKKSLLAKMPGPEWQKFANLRLLYSYMICHPGKKLLFMGGEIGQWDEWSENRCLDWHLLEYPLHKGMQAMVKAINHLYLEEPPLWERDFSWEGYQWVDFADQEHSVISYLRKSSFGASLLIVHHFNPETIFDYKIFLAPLTHIQEIFNTDALEYGGSGKINPSVSRFEGGFSLVLAPLATMIFEVQFGEDKTRV